MLTKHDILYRHDQSTILYLWKLFSTIYIAHACLKFLLIESIRYFFSRQAYNLRFFIYFCNVLFML